MKLIMSVKNHSIDIKNEKIIKSQKNKCIFCEMKIHNSFCKNYNINGKTFVSCNICSNVLSMDKINNKFESSIILLPEIEQSDVINLARSLFYFKKIKEKIPDDVDSLELIEEDLKERAELANHYYSKGISDTNILSQLLLLLEKDDEEMYKKRSLALSGLRWFPSDVFFEEEYKLLKDEYEKFEPKNWNILIKKITNQIN